MEHENPQDEELNILDDTSEIQVVVMQVTDNLKSHIDEKFEVIDERMTAMEAQMDQDKAHRAMREKTLDSRSQINARHIKALYAIVQSDRQTIDALNNAQRSTALDMRKMAVTMEGVGNSISGIQTVLSVLQSTIDRQNDQIGAISEMASATQGETRTNAVDIADVRRGMSHLDSSMDTIKKEIEQVNVGIDVLRRIDRGYTSLFGTWTRAGRTLAISIFALEFFGVFQVEDSALADIVRALVGLF